MNSNPTLIVTDGTSSQEPLLDNVNDVTQYKPPGILLLMLVKWERGKIKSGYCWAKKDAINIKRCKNNIITGHSNHFGSTGQYVSFGNRGNYGLIHNSSVAQFANKELKSKQKSKQGSGRFEKKKRILQWYAFPMEITYVR